MNLVKTKQQIDAIKNHLQKRYGDTAEQDGGQPVGQRDGVWMKAVPSKTSRAAGRKLKANQNPVPSRQTPLSAHRARAEQPIKTMSLEDIASRAMSMKVKKDVITRAAQRILNGQDPGLAESTEGDAARLLAYHLALHCLSPNSDRRTRAALLTPVGPYTDKPREVAAYLQEAFPHDREGGEALEALVEAVIKHKGGEVRGRGANSKSKEGALELRQRQVRRGDTSDDAVLDLLADWLEVPPLDADRDGRRALEVRNNLAGFTTDNRNGQRALRNVNTAAVAQTMPDPPTFQRVYGELSERVGQEDKQTPVQVVRALLNSHSAEQLHEVMNALLAAIGDDINADNPSNEANKLHASVQKLGDGFVGNTMVPRFKLATKRVNDFLLKHTQGAEGAAAA